MRLVVGADEWEPHMKVTQEVPGGPPHFQGPMMDVLLALARTMNFTFVLERPPDGSWGTPLPNGTVTGLVGMVHRQEVDLALGPFALTSGRAIVVDFAAPLFSDAPQLMGGRGRPEVDPWGFMLLPFAPSVWAATLCSMGIWVLAAVMLLTTPLKNRQGVREALRSLWQTVVSFVFLYCGVLFQQGLEASRTSRERRWVGRLVVIGWTVTAMVLAWSYMGGLTSLVAVRHVPQPFQTLAALGDHPSVLLMVAKNSAESRLLQTGGPVVLRGLEKVREGKRLRMVSRGYHNVYLPMANGEPWVVVVEAYEAAAVAEHHFALTGRCDYYTSREIIVSYPHSIILQKNSPLLRAVNARLQALTQGGLYLHWLQTALPNSSICRHSPSTVTVQDTLSLANLWGVFSVLAGGLGASLLAFVCELASSTRTDAAD
ncbi:glutamate receptor-like isoform X2 [Scylla paramamosain]